MGPNDSSLNLKSCQGMQSYLVDVRSPMPGQNCSCSCGSGRKFNQLRGC